jgi:hypothetical protein
MQHQGWVHQARAHLQEFQPKRFKELHESGQLENALTLAAESTSEAMSTLIGQGVPAGEAFEQAREAYLFPSPEKGAVDEQEPTDGYMAALQYQRAMKEFNNV